MEPHRTGDVTPLIAVTVIALIYTIGWWQWK